MTTSNISNPIKPTRNLSRLRIEAGYENGRAFAEASGIPEGSYYRYEAHPERIPVTRAWRIADFLGTSIDAVVGREDLSKPRPRTIEQVLQSLSREDGESLAAYIEFLESRTERGAC